MTRSTTAAGNNNNTKRCIAYGAGFMLVAAGAVLLSGQSNTGSHIREPVADMSMSLSAAGHTSEVKGGFRVNEVYYQNAGGGMGGTDVKPGTDLADLRAVSVNTLSVGFYNPEALLNGKYESYGNSAINDETGLADLAKKWQAALGKESGMFLVCVGGMTSTLAHFENAFKDGAKLGAAYGKLLSSLREKSGASSMQIGLDIDLEGPCDKERACGQEVRAQLGPFLKALRANGCPHDSCPVQLDVTLTFYFISAEHGRRWSLDAVLENGPTGNPTEGINYVSMMVNNVGTSGFKEKGYLNGETGRNTALLNRIAPAHTRIVNFWGTSDGLMSNNHVKLFVNNPGLSSLFAWMKKGGMGVAWFSWEATQKHGGSEVGYKNMKTVQSAVFK